MSAETQTAMGQTGESRCWCCGQIRSGGPWSASAAIPKLVSASAVSIFCGGGRETIKPRCVGGFAGPLNRSAGRSWREAGISAR
jgi:hypothetical protein